MSWASASPSHVPARPFGFGDGHPSPALHISEYDCDFVWGRSNNAAVSVPPEECIFSVVKWVLSRMGEAPPAASSGMVVGGPLWVVSLNGMHLPTGVKDRIWRRKFIDLLRLLPPDRELVDKSWRVNVTVQGNKLKQLPQTFGNWL